MVSKLVKFREIPGNPGSVVQKFHQNHQKMVPEGYEKEFCALSFYLLEASFAQDIVFLIELYKTTPSKIVKIR